MKNSDGSQGVPEGYCSRIYSEEYQKERYWLRNDLQGESAMSFAFYYSFSVKNIISSQKVKFKIFLIFFLTSLLFQSCVQKSNYFSPEIVIIGGGASGISAGISSARLGVSTLIVEETEWLGGMLTAAGVSAVDGNYNLPGGFFGEFRDSLANYYGGMDALKTGWVSSVLFEPSVGNQIFNAIAVGEENLKILFNSGLQSIRKTQNGWEIEVETPEGIKKYNPKIVIDATELGDVAKACGAGYDIGMDSRHVTGEEIAPEKSNNIIQDLTYVAILKDYGYDVTIPRPANYDSTQYFCCCLNPLCVSPKEAHRMWPQGNMISYGKLPNNKYMINWPIEGNDFYLNLIENTPEERTELLKQAKNFTLGFLYFMQTELGMNTFGFADDEFPTDDNLPLIPYYRESRRIHGVVQFTLNHISDPYSREQKLYRTAIGVGDYPVDHHHARYHEWETLPDLHFYPVPSYGLPLGVMISKDVDNLIVAEKSISVTNLVNGTTRLQPVVVQIGQAAGTLAALAVKGKKNIREVSVREVQRTLLENGAYLLPFLDVKKDNPLFLPLQRIGVTGILKGIGKNQGWANQTWFRSDDPLLLAELEGLTEIYPTVKIDEDSTAVTLKAALELISQIAAEEDIRFDSDITESAQKIYNQFSLQNFDLKREITRAEMVLLIDRLLQPFDRKEIDIYGFYKN